MHDYRSLWSAATIAALQSWLELSMVLCHIMGQCGDHFGWWLRPWEQALQVSIC